jgi:hypothetical protein
MSPQCKAVLHALKEHSRSWPRGKAVKAPPTSLTSEALGQGHNAPGGMGGTMVVGLSVGVAPQGTPEATPQGLKVQHEAVSDV